MMKKLVVVAAVVMITAGMVGCESCQWLRRGALFPTLAPDVVPCDPCPPAAGCDPYGTGGCATEEYLTPPAMMPGPGTYVPTPNG